MDNIYDKQDQVLGKVGGIFLSDINLDKDLLLKNLIDGIEMLRDKTMDSLIIEDLNFLDSKDIELIENKTRLKVLDGRDVLIQSLPGILDNIYTILGKSLQGEEVLIISDEEMEGKKTIELLYDKVQFITLIGEDEENIKNVWEYILQKTGLSIFNSKNIEKILKNYAIIINFKDEIFIDTSKIKRDSLIFDFSRAKKFSNSRGRFVVIEDLMFEVKNMNIKENIWIDKLVPSYIYEYVYNKNILDVEGLLVNKEIYKTKVFIEDGILRKVRL